MTTAADRLKQLSGLAGVSAAAMLLAIGTGATAEELLVSRSGLQSGTAAEHLLAEGQQPATEASAIRWSPPTVASLPIEASADTRESERAVAVANVVLLASAHTSERSTAVASAKVSVDKERIARRDEDLLWL